MNSLRIRTVCDANVLSEARAEVKREVLDLDARIPCSHLWASKVLEMAGVQLFPSTASCDAGANWYRKKKWYNVGHAYGGNYIPRIGDTCYFSTTYEQADATHVGIVQNCDGTLVEVACCSSEANPTLTNQTFYLSNPYIIGFGTNTERPLESYSGVDNGIGTVIANDTLIVRTEPHNKGKQVGTLPKGRSVEVLAIDTHSGWFKIAWSISKTGFAYVPTNVKYLRHVVAYNQSNSFYNKGDSVRCVVHKRLGRCDRFIGKVVDIIESGHQSGHQIEVELERGRRYKLPQKRVDIVGEPGYNVWKGKVTAQVLNLRVGPGVEFTKVQQWPQLVSGEVVSVFDEEVASDGAPWLRIFYRGHKGYVHSKYIMEC